MQGHSAGDSSSAQKCPASHARIGCAMYVSCNSKGHEASLNAFGITESGNDSYQACLWTRQLVAAVIKTIETLHSADLRLEQQ